MLLLLFWVTFASVRHIVIVSLGVCIIHYYLKHEVSFIKITYSVI